MGAKRKPECWRGHPYTGALNSRGEQHCEICRRISSKHATRRKAGEPISYVERTRPLSERFWEKVEIKGPDECWPWKATLGTSGYGQILEGGKYSRKLHSNRVAYELSVGPIPDGLMVCHTCDNRKCCNPAHLWLGTHQENMADMKAKGRARAPRADASPQAKITWEIVAAIRQSNEPQRKLSARFGISQSHVQRIRAGQNWKEQQPCAI